MKYLFCGKKKGDAIARSNTAKNVDYSSIDLREITVLDRRVA